MINVLKFDVAESTIRSNVKRPGENQNQDLESIPQDGQEIPN